MEGAPRVVGYRVLFKNSSDSFKFSIVQCFIVLTHHSFFRLKTQYLFPFTSVPKGFSESHKRILPTFAKLACMSI
jgi:hypothetical protein